MEAVKKSQENESSWEHMEKRAEQVIIEHSESACANHVCNAFAFCFWSFYAFFDFPFLTFCVKQSREESLKIAPKMCLNLAALFLKHRKRVLFIQQNWPHLWENRSLRFSKILGKFGKKQKLIEFSSYLF